MATGPGDHSLKLQLSIQDKASHLLGKIKSEFGMLGSVVHLVSDMFKNFNKAMMGLMSTILLTGLLTIIKLTKNIFMMNEQIAVMGQRFGMSKKEVALFNAQLFDAAKRGGVMVDQVAHVGKTLIEAGFKGRSKDIAELSVTMLKFSDVTGISLETGAEFATELNRIGYNSEALIKSMGGLRASLQLSQREMEAVMKTTQEASRAFFIFGGTASKEQMDANVKGISKFAAVMANLKLTTQETNDWIQTLISPTKFKENKLAQILGYGWEDITRMGQKGLGGVEQQISTLLDLRKRLGRVNFQDPNEVLRLVGPGKMFKDEAQFAWAKQISQLNEDQIRQAYEKVAVEKDLQDLYMKMGNVLIPLQKEWAKLLTEAMPLIVSLAGKLEGVVKWLTGIVKWMTEHKEATKMITMIAAVTMIGLLIRGWTVSLLGFVTELTTKGVGALTGAATGAGGIAEGLTKAGTAAKTLNTGVVGLGASLKVLGAYMLKTFGAGLAVGGVLGVFGKGRVEIRDIAQIVFGIGMMLGATPLGWTLMGIGGAVLLADRFKAMQSWTRAGYSFGKGFSWGEKEGTESANKVSEASNDIAANKNEAQKINDDLAKEIYKMTKNYYGKNENTAALLAEIKSVIRSGNDKNVSLQSQYNSARASDDQRKQ